MAKKGYKVTVYEKREDIRTATDHKGRSINLALSHRGRRALRAVGLESDVLSIAIPMKGRFIHNLNGDTAIVPYDSVLGQCIYSVGRNFLNGLLLDRAEKYPNVKLRFEHKIVGVDFNRGSISIRNVKTGESMEHAAQLIIGADGAHSILRRHMQTWKTFQYSQTYIEHGYLELSIPKENGKKMQGGHLHIWPRGKFMMIALPNQDGSWTVTLFMPFHKFNSLNTSNQILDFFKNTFPDSVPLIGEENLTRAFSKTQPSSLISIKCNPYDTSDKFLLIGDAAHAMVPFYGQGMNAGFEDCTLLDEILTRNAGNIADSLREFTRSRQEDAHAICDLAMYNYVEMRDLVVKPSYKARKALDDCLYRMFPEFWLPLYNSVSFSSVGYKKCVENRNWQNRILAASCIIFGIIFVGILLLLSYI